MADKNLKKEFSDFAEKISRLQSLKHEFEAIDSKGFEREAKIIRSKLKDVHAIPQLERMISQLRNEVLKFHARKQVKSQVGKKILAKSRSLEEDHKKIKSKIHELEQNLENKSRHIGKKQLTKSEVDDVKEIPKLQKQIGNLKNDLHSHVSASKMKVDTGVGLLVDAKFSDFLFSIKGELSQELKKKQKEMDEELSADLESREKIFAKKYHDVVQKYHDMYEKKVSSELDKEVRKQFNQKLNDELEKAKRKMVADLLKRDSERIAKEKHKLVLNLEKEFASKKEYLEKESNSKLKDYENKIKKDSEKNVLKIKSDYAKMEKELKEKYSKDKRGIFEKYLSKKKDLEKMKINLNNQIEYERRKLNVLLENAKKKYLKEFNAKVYEDKNKYVDMVEKIKADMAKSLELKSEQMRKEKDVEVRKKIGEVRSSLRSQFEKEYKMKLNQELKRQNIEMQRRKAELERHVMSQAKLLFK